ncbi:hypothetical protein AAZV13_14G110300 [Glycine max]
MGNPKTEEERIERVIRSLLKLPENRRCINCNLLGPQYVCTTFSTFVCTNCSGIHREFTHRVKSVSMAKFTPEEVTALQAGSNERAKQIYFKEWNPLRHSYPDSCNIHKLRDFIKHVYVERRYTGESCGSSLPRIKMSEKEESFASKKSSSFRFEIISPHSSSGPRSDDKNLRYIYDESRSPRYTQKYARHTGLSRNPIKIEVVDDRFQDDERRNRRLSNIASKLKQISIDGQKNVDKSQLPVERPLGEILRENASSLQATHSAAGGRPELPHTTQSNESNWAIFGASTENNDPTTPDTNTSKPSTKKTASEAAIPAKNPVDLLLFELSGPVTPVTGGMSQAASGTNNDPTTTTVDNGTTWDFPSTSVGQTTASPNNTSVWSFTSTPATESAQPSNEVPLHTEVSYAYKTSSMQYVPSVSTVCSSTTQPINSPVKDVASNNQPPSALPNAPKYSNPFDVTDGRSLIHVSSLPTMASFHGVPPPAVSPRTGLMHASSLGSLGTMVSQSPCYASPVPKGEYQVNNKEQPTRPQRAGSFNSELSAFGSLDPIQQSNRGLMTSKTANYFSNTRGNPFD